MTGTSCARDGLLQASNAWHVVRLKILWQNCAKDDLHMVVDCPVLCLYIFACHPCFYRMHECSYVAQRFPHLVIALLLSQRFQEYDCTANLQEVLGLHGQITGGLRVALLNSRSFLDNYSNNITNMQMRRHRIIYFAMHFHRHTGGIKLKRSTSYGLPFVRFQTWTKRNITEAYHRQFIWHLIN